MKQLIVGGLLKVSHQKLEVTKQIERILTVFETLNLAKILPR